MSLTSGHHSTCHTLKNISGIEIVKQLIVIRSPTYIVEL